MFVFNQIKKKTKRQAYIRSAYFQKDKIFFNYFWDHLFQKPHKDRVRRLQYFEAAIELIIKSHNAPEIESRDTNKRQIYYRFAGFTQNKELFCVQIKEDKRTGNKFFMSCFPGK